MDGGGGVRDGEAAHLYAGVWRGGTLIDSLVRQIFIEHFLYLVVIWTKPAFVAEQRDPAKPAYIIDNI